MGSKRAPKYLLFPPSSLLFVNNSNPMAALYAKADLNLYLLEVGDYNLHELGRSSLNKASSTFISFVDEVWNQSIQ